MKKFVLFAPYFILITYSLYLIYLYKINPEETFVYFRIQGYDPVHITKGHYLLFRVKYNDTNFPCVNQNNENFCGCFIESEKIYNYSISKINEIAICNTLKCKHKISMECKNGFWEVPNKEYYISEENAEKIQFIPPNSFIQLSIHKNYKSKIEQILVFYKDKVYTIEEYAKIK